MSKHKTRQQKIIADLHRKLHSHQSLQEEKISSVQKESSTHYTYSLKQSLPSLDNKATLTIPLPYIKKDLYKTLFVTTTIIVAQIVLFYLLKSHIIILPWVRY